MVIILFLIPFLSGAFFLISSKNWKPLAVVLSLLPLVMLLLGHQQWIGNEISYPWIPALHINFHLRVDALSLFFLYLAAIIIPISLAALSRRQLVYPSAFYGLILLLQGLLIGFFTAADLVLFTVFWESMLLPLYFIITLYGGQQRQKAALKFLIYMLAGSVLMIMALLALYLTASSGQQGATFDIQALAEIISHAPWALGISGIFLLAFAVKTPLFPFHGWLPEVYDQAPRIGTVLLAALLSKAGIYGFFRIGGGLFSEQMMFWNPWLLGLAMIGVFYGALAAWQQSDLKKVIAYSSLSHVNFILVGIFVWNGTAHLGSLFQVVNHGITISALFLAVGWLKDRTGTTSIKHLGGLAKYFPHLCWVTLLFLLSSIALPGMNNFVGEFLIFFGFFKYNVWMAVLLVSTVILSAIYMLRWMQRVYFGPLHSPHAISGDLSLKEKGVALPLLLLIFWLGIYPMPTLKLAEEATGDLHKVQKEEVK